MLDKTNLTSINNTIRRRILNHKEFAKNRIREKGEKSIKYVNDFFDFPVMTRQEKK